MPQLLNHYLVGPSFIKRTDFTPYTFFWGEGQLKVIYWNRAGTSERLPCRNPKTHTPQDTIERQRYVETCLDTTPMKSRREKRRKELEKRQHAYGKRHHKNHEELLESLLSCLELNRELHPDQLHIPRHRVLTSKPGKWYKTQKVATHQSWCRGKRIRNSKRQVRSAMKTKTRKLDVDYVVKTSWDNATRRHRSER